MKIAPRVLTLLKEGTVWDVMDTVPCAAGLPRTSVWHASQATFMFSTWVSVLKFVLKNIMQVCFTIVRRDQVLQQCVGDEIGIRIEKESRKMEYIC